MKIRKIIKKQLNRKLANTPKLFIEYLDIACFVTCPSPWTKKVLDGLVNTPIENYTISTRDKDI